MPEQQAQVKDTWEGLGTKALADWVANTQQEQVRYYKANEGKFDDDRYRIFKSKNEELERAQKELGKQNEAETIYRKTVEAKEQLNQPAGGVPFENGGGQVNESVTN